MEMASNNSCNKTPLKYKQTDLNHYFGSSPTGNILTIPKIRLKSPKLFSSPSVKDTIILLSDSDGSDSEAQKIIIPKKEEKSLPVSDAEDIISVNMVNKQKKNRTMMKLNNPKELEALKCTPSISDIHEHNEPVCLSPSPSLYSDSSNDTIILDSSTLDLKHVSDFRDSFNGRKHVMELTKREHDTPTKKCKKQHMFDCVESDKRNPGQEHLNLNAKNSLQEQSVNSNSNFDTHQDPIPSTSGTSNGLSNGGFIRVSRNLFQHSTPTKISNNKAKRLTSPKKSEKALTEEKLVTSVSIHEPETNPPARDHSKVKEEEDVELNFSHLDCLTDLFRSSIENHNVSNFLEDVDIKNIKEFLGMDKNYKYFLMKLFIYLPKWYNMSKLCKKIHLDQVMSSREMTTMCEFLGHRQFVDTDVTLLDIDELLNMLLLGELKQVSAKFKPPKMKTVNKSVLINFLKAKCRTQSTLSTKKSIEDILKETIHEQMGRLIKMKHEVRETFYKTYLIQTFVNTLYLDPQKYLSDMNYLKVSYPEYNVEEYNPFSCRDKYMRFYEAALLKKDFLDASDNNNHVAMKDCCDKAFESLKNISSAGKWDRQLDPHLRRFSAEYQYISILKASGKRLIKDYDNVKKWLEYLIKNYPTHSDIGFWYKLLAHIQIRYMKDYELATKTVIEAFELNDKNHIFNLVQVHDLSIVARKLHSTKSFKLGTSYCKQLESVAQTPVTSDNFPKKTITGRTDRSGTSGRRTYSFIDGNNERNFGNVEKITLNHYQIEENYEGIHCEGRLIAILFTLLFWDIIYLIYVPRTFISKFQNAPLDMFSTSFYKNRKQEIDLRLQEIAENWPQEKLEEVLEENWNNHLHQESFMKLDVLTSEFGEILVMFHCIKRTILSKIFERLVSNYRRFHSGFPDLFLWNSEICKCKFVEVKGENDKLSLTQMLWIQYLIDIGADVEVCHVSGVGARKLTMPKHDELTIPE